MWAFKAEKGSDFIAPNQPILYSQQQSTENNDYSCAETASGDVHYLALGMTLLKRRSKLLLNRQKMSEL